MTKPKRKRAVETASLSSSNYYRGYSPPQTFASMGATMFGSAYRLRTAMLCEAKLMRDMGISGWGLLEDAANSLTIASLERIARDA